MSSHLPSSKISLICVLILSWLPATVGAQTPKPGSIILDELKKGGLVLYLRHAHANVGEDRLEDPTYWKDCAKQRMMRAEGRLHANRIGIFIRAHGIPIGQVVSGELCRVKETAQLIGLGTVTLSQGLNDYNTWKAQGNDPEKLVAAYRAHLSAVPPKGTNIVLVSHTQRGRFSAHPVLDLIEMGTVAVFRPSRSGGFELLAVLRPDDWQYLGFAELPSR